MTLINTYNIYNSKHKNSFVNLLRERLSGAKTCWLKARWIINLLHIYVYLLNIIRIYLSLP